MHDNGYSVLREEKIDFSSTFLESITKKELRKEYTGVAYYVTLGALYRKKMRNWKKLLNLNIPSGFDECASCENVWEKR